MLNNNEQLYKYHKRENIKIYLSVASFFIACLSLIVGFLNWQFPKISPNEINKQNSNILTPKDLVSTNFVNSNPIETPTPAVNYPTVLSDFSPYPVGYKTLKLGTSLSDLEDFFSHKSLSISYSSASIELDKGVFKKIVFCLCEDESDTLVCRINFHFRDRKAKKKTIDDMEFVFLETDEEYDIDTSIFLDTGEEFGISDNTYSIYWTE